MCGHPGVGGGGTLPNFWVGGVGVQQSMKKWTQQDMMFCKNEGSKRSKNYKKRGSIGSKIKEKIGTNRSNDRFL